MYRVQGPSVLYDLRASSLDPRTIRLPLAPSAGCFRARPRALSPLRPGRRSAHVSLRLALVAAVADAPLAIDTFDIRRVTATRRISISLRSVKTCSPTGSQPIQHLWSAQTSSLGPTPVTRQKKMDCNLDQLQPMMEMALNCLNTTTCPEPETPTPKARTQPVVNNKISACLYKLYSTPTGAQRQVETMGLSPAIGLATKPAIIRSPVSGRVPEIQIPVRKRDSPDFKVTRQARTGYLVDASVTTSTGYC
ncbi:uncharacterized protein MEPE_06847 [Melanopsichium pennsylvanicum]|uniref:Uncharacterized protein n=1 Tax=Melanopsichium pennsylvanicum TaxID=63383 RepID=A0AAJ4XTR8_9BASI|nr:uncharacterized protein MEPE_06847 [Melanopsichium pennsylvanicum]